MLSGDQSLRQVVVSYNRAVHDLNASNSQQDAYVAFDNMLCEDVV